MSQRTVAQQVQALALILALQTAAAYDFNFGGSGGYSLGIHNSAKYYESHSINPSQYASELATAIRSSNGSGDDAGRGFANAATRALEDKAFRAFAYICEGAVAFDPTPNGGEGASGQEYCSLGLMQVKSDGYNVSAAVNGAFAAGKEIDTQFGTQVTGDFRRFSEYSGQ